MFNAASLVGDYPERENMHTHATSLQAGQLKPKMKLTYNMANKKKNMKIDLNIYTYICYKWCVEQLL